MYLMKRSVSGLALASALILNTGVIAQTTQPTSKPTADENPPAEGFNLEGSDAKAIAIADAVMAKMGGRKAWDDTRYITWKFFGVRLHYWDKHTGNIRVETNRDDVHTVLLANLNTNQGRAWIDGEEITETEKLAEMMKSAHSAWINDAYWLVMPYKLKDSGVTLKYAGEKNMEDGRAADVLELTFDSVGNTPQNKYEVFVAKDSGLVEQWSYFSTAADEEARMTTPWQNWEKHGNILLSADRGMRRGQPSRHTDVGVYETLPESVFTDPGPIDLPKKTGAMNMSTGDDLTRLASLLGEWEGSFTIHHENEDFAIRWKTDWSFEGRTLRFEFSATEKGRYGYMEWIGLFNLSDDGQSLETVCVSQDVHDLEGRFLSSSVLFCEKGTFDEAGKVLTLKARHQWAADQPETSNRSVFTLIDENHFTIEDAVFDLSMHGWKNLYTFDLT